MVHYGFNLGSPAANSAPERTGGRYATRHAGLNARSIGAEARQPKAGLLWAGLAGVRYRPTPPTRPPEQRILCEVRWGRGPAPLRAARSTT